MEVIKRDGSKVAFDGSKIENAILKAMRYGSGIVKPEIASKISHEIEDWHKSSGAASISIYRIEGQVFEKLIEKGEVLTAKAYEGYRKVREFQRETNTIDNAIYGIVNQTNKEAMDENSNKDATVLATQRDLIAGEFSRDYCRRLLLPPKIVQAHDDGIIHFHDMDYYIQKMHNCDLVNLKDMFANGTVINDKLIETPKSLQTACTVATQIVQQVANGQYGGQTISISHLAPYVRVSYKKHLKAVRKEGKEVGIDYTEEQIEKIAKSRLHEEIKAGVQTIQYQINTFSTTNGQAPFLSIFMYLREEPDYIEETALLIEEILKQRYIGMKNPVGAYVTPAFPKLLYVLDDNNVPDDSQYRYLTDLAVKCVSKRMMPDFISAKIMRENYEGQVFPCMGCRSFLTTYLDNLVKYNIKNKDLDLLSSNYSIPYMNYDNTYSGISKEKLYKYLDNKLTLSYTALENFYKCKFKYYISNILKINIIKDDFAILIGDICHYVLRCMDDQDFDYDTCFNNYVKTKREFSKRELFFLDNIKEELESQQITLKKVKIIDTVSEYATIDRIDGMLSLASEIGLMNNKKIKIDLFFYVKKYLHLYFIIIKKRHVKIWEVNLCMYAALQIKKVVLGRLRPLRTWAWLWERKKRCSSLIWTPKGI